MFVPRPWSAASPTTDSTVFAERSFLQGTELLKLFEEDLIYAKTRLPLGQLNSFVLEGSTHEIGPLLGPRWPNKYGKQGERQVQRDMVFTIEPSVTSKFGTCNLEQDVLVTPNGYHELSKPQHEIIQLG